MSLHLRPGQKVVCIKDDGHLAPWKIAEGTDLDGLTKGRIYTVLHSGLYMGQPSVWLLEIKRRQFREFGEPGFSPERFRPVQKHKTDISIFTAMLNLSKQNVEA